MVGGIGGIIIMGKMDFVYICITKIVQYINRFKGQQPLLADMYSKKLVITDDGRYTEVRLQYFSI